LNMKGNLARFPAKGNHFQMTAEKKRPRR
jgi:hypothetical protein